jgi:alpha-beta hydrolase superfamily lysophospholipase
VACHAPDLRGHGRSSGRRGYVTRWDEYLDDLHALLELSELRPDPASPLFVLGHSHGGLVVAVAAVRGLLDRAVSGCILSAPYLVNGLPVPAYSARRRPCLMSSGRGCPSVPAFGPK